MLNTKEEKVEFLKKTLEESLSGVLPYLDVFINSNSSNTPFSVKLDSKVFIKPTTYPGDFYWEIFDIKRNIINSLLEISRQSPEIIGMFKISSFKLYPSFSGRSNPYDFNIQDKHVNRIRFTDYRQWYDVPLNQRLFHISFTEEELGNLTNLLEQMNSFEGMFRERITLFTSASGKTRTFFLFRGPKSLSFSLLDLKIAVDGIFFKKQKIRKIKDIIDIQSKEQRKKDLKSVFDPKKEKTLSSFERAFIRFSNEAFPKMRPFDKPFIHFITANEKRFRSYFRGDFSIEIMKEQKKIFINFDNGEKEDLTLIFYRDDLQKYFSK